tara:strand:+ start:881 stop:1450 length:570 start_codon:yes stop_codon:yes gene_type:complete
MRKINKNMDNFVDNIFIDISKLLCPLFKYFNFTPNMITGINIICSILCLYYLYIEEYKLGALFLILTYLFDALDGFYARKYKMETHFGDLLDHYTDYIFYTGLYYLLLFKISFKNNTNFIFILSILTITSILHLGCTEHYNLASSKVNTQLSQLKKMCPNKKYIHYTKYLGPGTSILFIIISLLFYIEK